MDYIREIRALVGHRPLLLCGSGAYIVVDDKILLQRRLDNGFWAAHGGILEPGESTEETMLREVYEETGLTVTDYDFLCVTSGKDVHCIYPNGDECYFVNTMYLVTGVKGTTHRQETEVDDLRWFDLADLPPESDVNPVDLPSYRVLKARLGIQ